MRRLFRSSPKERRQAALAPILDELDLQFGKPNTPIPETVIVSQGELALEPWERTYLREFLQRDTTEPNPLASVLSESIAYQLKCQAALDTECDRNAAAIAELLDERIQDTALGLALLDTTRRVLDDLDGEPVTARMARVLRAKLGATVRRLRRLIGDAAFEQAASRSAKLGAAERAAATVRAESPDDPMPRVSPEVEPRRRLVRRCAWLAGMVVTWCLLILPRYLEPQPPLFEPADFSGLPAVVGVVPRPPSLFIELDPAAWDGLDVAERADLVEQVGELLGGSSFYSGSYLRTTDGRNVGRWLRRTGAELLAP